MKLRTRDSDGAALCAQEGHDVPSRYAEVSTRMPNAPGVIGCSMTCTADYQCHHFNYVPTDSQHPCHLYYYSPTHFNVEPNCMHYEMPGKTSHKWYYVHTYANPLCSPPGMPVQWAIFVLLWLLLFIFNSSHFRSVTSRITGWNFTNFLPNGRTM